MVFISVGDYENAKRIIELYELQLNNISSKPLSYYLGQIESLLSEYECGKPSLAFYDGTLKHYVDCSGLLANYDDYRYAKILRKLVQIRWENNAIIF